MKALLLMLLLCCQGALAALPGVSSGHIERLEDFPSEFVPARHVDIWLPESYRRDQPHAVVYMHDGQVLFDGTTSWNKQEWRVDEVAGALIAEGKTRPFIVVGVFNGGANRHSEYSAAAVHGADGRTATCSVSG